MVTFNYATGCKKKMSALRRIVKRCLREFPEYGKVTVSVVSFPYIRGNGLKQSRK